jgi:hypothetical protein
LILDVDCKSERRECSRKAAPRLSVNGIASFRVLSSLAPISTVACDNDRRACRRGTASRPECNILTPRGHVKDSRSSLDDARNSSRSLFIMSPSPAREGSANAGSSSGNLEEKPRLSEHEKKANHIASGSYSFPSDSYLIIRFHALVAPAMLTVNRQNISAAKSFARVSTGSPS